MYFSALFSLSFVFAVRGAAVFGSSRVKGEDGSAHMTYYTPGESANTDACGQVHTSTDYTVAISHQYFDSFAVTNPENNPLCNKNIRITYKGQSIVAAITDRCVDCEGRFDIKAAPAVMSKLLPDWNETGSVTGITWQFTHEQAETAAEPTTTTEYDSTTGQTVLKEKKEHRRTLDRIHRSRLSRNY
ncbi:hypothetical protein DL96DRAFT_1286573 [Flagelloscypha sp. PMI_526]|nr:hypothetical protein DL96DRAFT_1286573 [Flagelloscypha sp. PMI_526]